VAISSIDGLSDDVQNPEPADIMITNHSSEDSESVNVGVGRRLRLRELPSSTDATASLSARRFKVPPFEVEATAAGGGEAEGFNWPLVLSELSYERSFSSCSRRMPNRKSPRLTK
jgi:hypothetical protein